MNPVTHLFASWAFAESFDLDSRDTKIVAWLGLTPDLDGLGGVIDISYRLFGFSDPEFYGQFHHELLHGIFGAILLPSLAVILTRNKLKVFLLCFLVIHLHLLCDFFGSRGLNVEDIWPINYLAPFSHDLSFSWTGQWQINAWQNIVITIGLIIFMFVRTIRNSHSIISLFNQKAHNAFVLTVQTRWNKIRNR